jgi:hypothetical protein
MRVAILGLIAVFFVPSCTNVSQRGGKSTTGNPAVFSGADFTSVSYTHQLSNVNASQVASGTGGNNQAQVSLALALNTNIPDFKPISQFCGVSTNPCRCEMTWNQTDQNGAFLNERTKRILVTTIQSGSVSCLLSQSDWDEIVPGTVIKLNIIPAGTNATGLNCKSINYRKGSVTNPNGDFLDDTLNAFRNIHRYTCHSKRTSPHELLNRYQDVSKVSSADPAASASSGDPDAGAPVRTSVATCFCSSASGSSSGSGACSGLPCPENPRSGYSAQNYYRNLYVRSDLMGQINSSNNTYDCPKVLESVKTSASSGPTGTTTIAQAEQNKYWPLDSSFALATQWSPDWSIGIMAGSILLKPNDPNTTTVDTCRNSDARFIENGIFPKCLGFAKPANADGTCGTMTDSNGNVRPLVRLRRYRAVLPPRFDPNGDIEGGSGGGQSQQNTFYPAVDEVYVADRLVLDSNSLPTGDMIYGPKPCNYAWFDHEGVVTRRTGTANLFGTNVYRSLNIAGGGITYNDVGVPSYIGTNRFFRQNTPSGPTWNESLSVNPDGLIFPNHDRFGGGIGSRNQASCSASIPVVNYNQGQAQSVSLFTSSSLRLDSDTLSLGNYLVGSKSIYRNEIHLRPIDPWVPHYMEDTSFKACAPLSSEFTEPPLHFYKDANNQYAWCAETYPSQNPYWAEINKKRRIVTPTSSTNPEVINQTNLVGYPAAAGATTPPVLGFTSHVNSGAFPSQPACSGTVGPQICNMTSPGSTNCVNFLARPSANTCDRTVMFDPFQNYRDFPILANSADTETMLRDDLSHSKSYSCTYSVSKDPSKVNSQYPSTACCGVRTGTPVLDSLISGGGGVGGHLEPLQDAAAPNYRFCGSPVQ